ncbi:hypothetical protein B0J13DRAFT_9144 [Dactylonectria estremocensis]|uniref:DUF1295 domain-containing protein n=1 Tax=Dactylonectria estremocensis TaxID=1079267 RepID=A0A9P9JDE5_9HYPO|nr:hypothetical protein B0J13DRAFT_9144 [Dactylonectria estremocensis]
MAIPLLKSIEDCGDFSKTVEPFLPQLYALPNQILENIASPAALSQLYIDTNPLISAFAASLVLGFIFLVVSEINRNWSQVDRLWSLLPNLYIIHIAVWARLAGMPHARIDLIAIFSTAWSCRLTYNYWRKGGYNVGSEDYRWAIVKSYVPNFIFFIFNVTFISFIQSVLLFAISAIPAYNIQLSTQFESDITTADISFLVLELALVVSEWFSDGQQWTYQAAKHQYLKDAQLPKGFHQADLDRGFITSGLWAYSRHPNFFAEQTIWFVLYQWSCFATNNLYNWTFAGAASLILLFQGSTWLTEAITRNKYPEYSAYQKQVARFFPTTLQGYRTSVQQPKIIKTSELENHQPHETKKQL